MIPPVTFIVHGCRCDMCMRAERDRADTSRADRHRSASLRRGLLIVEPDDIQHTVAPGPAAGTQGA